MKTAHCALIACWLAFSVSGCGSSSPVRYFGLEPAGPPATTADEDAAIVGIGPLRFPEYLSKPQIMSRSAGGEIKVYEFDRWVEPVDEAVHRILAINVERAVDNMRVIAFPYDVIRYEYQVHGSIERFDADSNGLAVLIAQWGIVTEDRQLVVAPHRVIYSATISGNAEPGAIVQALNDTLGQFGDDIATRLNAAVNGR